VIWAMPVLLALIGLLVILQLLLRARAKRSVALSAEEQSRLREILGKD